MKKITIYTDGACQGNPGPGGWAAVLLYGEHRKEIFGGEAATTNNRMEMRAALEALRTLNQACEVAFFTDSEYLRKGITQWIFGWKARNWMTKLGTPVENSDLWRELDVQRTRHSINWHWLKGHAGHQHNERCDTLARSAVDKIKKNYSPEKLKAALTEFKAKKKLAAPKTLL